MLIVTKNEDAGRMLRGKVWHATSIDNYHSILSAGHISRNPKRELCYGDPINRSFVQQLAGISLFDLREFDEPKYEDRNPCANWRFFLGRRWNTDAVWIAVRIECLADKFVSGKEMLARWDKSNPRRNIIPEIEAASLMNIPIEFFGETRLFKYFQT